MFTNLLSSIGSVVSNIILSLALITGAVPLPEPQLPLVKPIPEIELGANLAALADFRTSLASSITANATEMTLVSFESGSDELIPGEQYGFKIGGSEYVRGTASTSNRIVDMVRGLSRRTGTSTVDSYRQPWGRGTAVEMTDAPLILEHSNLLSGVAAFENVIRYSSSTATSSFSTGKDIVSKEYVDGIAFNGAGVIDATTTAKGVVEIATRTEAGSSTVSGSSGVLVLPASLSTTTYNAATAANVIPVTNANGEIDDDFLPNTIGTTTTFTASSSFAATTTFSGYANLNRLLAVRSFQAVQSTTATTAIATATIPASSLTTNSTVRAKFFYHYFSGGANPAGVEFAVSYGGTSTTTIPLLATTTKPVDGSIELFLGAGATTANQFLTVEQNVATTSANAYGLNASTTAGVISLPLATDSTADKPFGITVTPKSTDSWIHIYHAVIEHLR